MTRYTEKRERPDWRALSRVEKVDAVRSLVAAGITNRRDIASRFDNCSYDAITGLVWRSNGALLTSGVVGRPALPATASDPLVRAVADAMRRSGLNQKQIAARAGVHELTISNLRRPDKGRSVHASTLSYVLQALGATVTVTLPSDMSNFQGCTKTAPKPIAPNA